MLAFGESVLGAGFSGVLWTGITRPLIKQKMEGGTTSCVFTDVLDLKLMILSSFQVGDFKRKNTKTPCGGGFVGSFQSHIPASREVAVSLLRPHSVKNTSANRAQACGTENEWGG